jgi:hypothetical protein
VAFDTTGTGESTLGENPGRAIMLRATKVISRKAAMAAKKTSRR